MRVPSLKLLAVAVLGLGLVGLVTDQVLASTPTVKGKGKLFSSFTTIITPNITFNNDVLQVPEKQTFVLTDIIATNTGAETNGMGLLCFAPGEDAINLLPSIRVAPDATFTHTFGTGLECPELTTLRLVPEELSGTLKIVVIGYFRKGS
jgi:hypothetical protein